MRLRAFELYSAVEIAEALLDKSMPLAIDLTGARALDRVRQVGAGLGALGAIMDAALFERRLAEAMEIAKDCPLPKGVATSSVGSLCARSAAEGLREAIGDHADGHAMPASREWTYWNDDDGAKERWAKRRVDEGLVHDESLASRAALCIWRGVESELDLAFTRMRGHYPGGEARWISEVSEHLMPIAECLARGCGAEGPMLASLSKWAPYAKMPTIDQWSFWTSWPRLGEGSVQTNYTGWVIADCARKEQPGRLDFPWAAWVALVLPELAPTWGRALGGQVGRADANLLRALSTYQSRDGEVWVHGEREDCARAHALLDALATGWEMDREIGAFPPQPKEAKPRI